MENSLRQRYDILAIPFDEQPPHSRNETYVDTNADRIWKRLGRHNIMIPVEKFRWGTIYHRRPNGKLEMCILQADGE